MAIKVLKSARLLEAGFELHGFTAGASFGFGAGDDEQVADNYRQLKAQLQSERPLARLCQVHGDHVVRSTDSLVDKQDWGIPPSVEGDVLVDQGAGVVSVVTADCVPILLADVQSGVVAAIHAGWKGLKAGVVRQAVREMGQLGADVRNMLAVTGPSICENCYEVGEEVGRHFPESVDPVKGKPGKYLLELRLAAEVSLIGAGLNSTNMERVGGCTACGSAALYSVRKQGAGTGRQLAFIAGLAR